MNKEKTFTYIKTIEQFDFELLTYLSSGDKFYVKKLCDVIDKSSLPWEFTYLIAEVTPKMMDDYISKKIDFLSLLSKNEVCWVMHEKDVVLSLKESSLSEIPADYLPNKNVFHDETLI